MCEHATAFVPGHVTGFFSAHPDPDPTRAGSRGAGIALTDGVEVAVTPASETKVLLEDEPTAIEPVRTVLDSLSVTAHVSARSDVPLGSGFGVSGAMALGTALAANRVFDRRRSRNELIAIAHRAEVDAGTGLGDVVAQACGGVPIRLEPGAPPAYELDRISDRTRVEYVSFGELSTTEILSGDTDLLTAAGERALERLLSEPTLETFMNASRTFAREAELFTEPVLQAVEEVAEHGGMASMAMLGNTVFAFGTALSEAGYDPSVCRTDVAGGHLRG